VAADLVGDEGIEWIEFSQQHAGAYGIIQNFCVACSFAEVHSVWVSWSNR
jgi:hypothetical protein